MYVLLSFFCEFIVEVFFCEYSAVCYSYCSSCAHSINVYFINRHAIIRLFIFSHKVTKISLFRKTMMYGIGHTGENHGLSLVVNVNVNIELELSPRRKRQYCFPGIKKLSTWLVGDHTHFSENDGWVGGWCSNLQLKLFHRSPLLVKLGYYEKYRAERLNCAWRHSLNLWTKERHERSKLINCIWSGSGV